MIGILPGRLATRQRLAVGAMIVAGTSLLNLIAVQLGPFGSPWPLALLWAICGWSALGPNVTTAFLLFGLGLWVDTLTGAPLGTWPVMTLVTHAIVIAMARFLGTGNFGRAASATLCGIVMLLVMVAMGLWRDGGFYFLGALVPLVGGVGLYLLIGSFFELSEDET